MHLIEEWRQIEGYEGYYEVSNLGNIRSVDRVVPQKNNCVKAIHGRLIRQSTHYKTGYKSVMLSKNGVHKRLSVHRLVGKAFLPNPDNLPEINHKDENKANNSVDNLEWCDHSYNNRYGTIPQRKSEWSSKRVEQFDLITGDVIATFPSGTVAARTLGFPQTSISACCHGKTNHCRGYGWRFI